MPSGSFSSCVYSECTEVSDSMFCIEAIMDVMMKAVASEWLAL